MPLTRPLFIYVNAQKAQQNKALAKFVTFYLTQAETVVEEVGYLPLPSSAYKIAQINFQENQVGTVFKGSPVLNTTINDILTKRYGSENAEGYVF